MRDGEDRLEQPQPAREPGVQVAAHPDRIGHGPRRARGWRCVSRRGHGGLPRIARTPGGCARCADLVRAERARGSHSAGCARRPADPGHQAFRPWPSLAGGRDPFGEDEEVGRVGFEGLRADGRPRTSSADAPGGGRRRGGRAPRGRAGAAVHWAAAEARDRGVALRLVHGLVVPRGGYPGRSVVGVDAERGLFSLARQELRDMRLVARDVAPDLPIVEDLVESDPVAVLRAQARVASLLVLGSDGFGRLGELALGGTARGLAGRVAVPVVLVPHHCDARRGEGGGHAPVAVGDDGTEGCRGALRFAALRAASRGAPLVVVRAGKDVRLLDEDVPDLGSASGRSPRRPRRGARGPGAGRPGPRRGARGPRGGGARRRHRRPRTRFGLVRRATCPVAIVPPGPGGRSR